MLTPQMTGSVAGGANAPIEPAYWHTMNDFLTHAALVTLSVTVTGLLIAAVIHFAVVGLLDRADRRSAAHAAPGESGQRERPFRPFSREASSR